MGPAVRPPSLLQPGRLGAAAPCVQMGRRTPLPGQKKRAGGEVRGPFPQLSRWHALPPKRGHKRGAAQAAVNSSNVGRGSCRCGGPPPAHPQRRTKWRGKTWADRGKIRARGVGGRWRGHRRPPLLSLPTRAAGARQNTGGIRAGVRGRVRRRPCRHSSVGPTPQWRGCTGESCAFARFPPPPMHKGREDGWASYGRYGQCTTAAGTPSTTPSPHPAWPGAWAATRTATPLSKTP